MKAVFLKAPMGNPNRAESGILFQRDDSPVRAALFHPQIDRFDRRIRPVRGCQPPKYDIAGQVTGRDGVAETIRDDLGVRAAIFFKAAGLLRLFFPEPHPERRSAKQWQKTCACVTHLEEADWLRQRMMGRIIKLLND